MTNNKEMVEALQIGDQCHVKWCVDPDEEQQEDDTSTLRAVVVERRDKAYRRKRKQSNNDSLPAIRDPSTLAADEIEYYVHFVDHDRRLDNWYTLDKFELDTLHRVEAPEIVSLDENQQQPSAFMRRRSSASLSNSYHGTAPSSIDGDNDDEANAALSNFSLTTGGNWHGGTGDPSLAAFEKDHEETTKVKNIEKIIMGQWEVEAWYYSPFPADYCDLETLYVCENCLKYMRKVSTFKKHRDACQCSKPPGREVYRSSPDSKNGEVICAYELDGSDHRLYCQNLCLLAKLFLDHKTLYYDPNPFMFYIVTVADSQGFHVVGYFSKEKESAQGYNLACILTFPQHQKRGFGKFLISLSYELSKLEEKTGSPEKPLSDLGKLSYRSYWTHVLFNEFSKHETDSNKDISISELSRRTAIKTEDIISTLQSLDMIKVWKGQHVVYVKQEIIQNYMNQKKQLKLCQKEFLHWEPPVKPKPTEQTQSSSNSPSLVA